MVDSRISVARQFMTTYADGDAEALLACLDEDWVLHEEDGSNTSCSDLAEITRRPRGRLPREADPSGFMNWLTAAPLPTTFASRSSTPVAITTWSRPASDLSCRR